MKKYGLIGYPLSHSFSKKYFEDKFERESISSRFDLYPIADLAQLPSLIRTEPLLQGLAVTIPHKQQVMNYLHEISEEATVIGAVNCIRISNGKLTGFNTDVYGFEKSLFPLLKSYHTHALVLGTGGSSKAVQYVLQTMQISYELVSSSGKSHLNYTDLNKECLGKYLLIINCTPLGMYPDVDGLPSIPYHFLTERHIVFDLVYNPEKTAFLQEGEKYGARIKNGLEMLHLQADENWRIWNS